MNVGIVDDDPSVVNMLEDQLDFDGLSGTTEFETARDWLQTSAIDCLLTDLKLNGHSGMDLLKIATELDEPVPVVMMTGYGSVDSAVEAMKNGARDYLQKPVDVEELRLVLERVEEEQEARTQLEGFRAARDTDTSSLLIGNSEPMQSLRQMIERVAQESINVLIRGETGTGKELVAREIHRRSERSDAPFIAVNCAAIPENLLESELFGHVKGAFTGAEETRRGKIELADGGTVFLDEIGEMPVDLQPKILRVLEQERLTKIGGESSRSVDVRFLSATNRDLDEHIEAETFRKDLYYRLQGIEIEAPPLREHSEDVPELVEHFLSELAGEGRPEYRCESEVLERMKGYDWPGNVRELRNVVERAAVLTDGDAITTEVLPAEMSGESSNGQSSTKAGWWRDYGESLDEAIRGIEREIIEETVAESDGNKAEAARRLGISRQSLHYKLSSK